MKKLKIAFLWHMHQPYYFDDMTNEFMLPWVRLHTIRGYYDMIKILEKHPKIKLDFNFSPSLFRQIEKYYIPNNLDKYYLLSMKNPADLTEDEKIFILTRFFMINWDTVIHKYPRYDALLRKRGIQVTRDIIKESVNIFTKQDFMDLQVWFNLGWFGFTLRNENVLVKDLIEKGSHYTQFEKEALLQLQKEILKKIIPLYKKYQESGQIEITLSPFYHPIIPLLCDNNSALESMPSARLPKDQFRFPEDASIQIRKSIEYYKEKFEKDITGMWPSEGSVSNEGIKIFAENGVKWIATDEQVLFNSIGSHSDRGKTLYQPYNMKFNDKEIAIFFRDHMISDSIGFKYSKMSADDAVNDIISNLKNTHDHLKNKDEDYIVSIILDGENAWEYYYDSGEEFLNKLYDRIENDDDFESTTFKEYLEKYPVKQSLDRIVAGSWINHNFDIWIGGYEENKAWALLNNTRQFLRDYIKSSPEIDKDKMDKVWEELFQAEGSDWFWWYGDHFSTINDEEFDALFRKHQKNIYLLLNTNPPENIDIPISEKSKLISTIHPKTVLRPIIDGMVDNYFEWWGAGKYDPKIGSSMASNINNLIKTIYYGYNNTNLFFRFDIDNIDSIIQKKNFSIKINFIRPDRCKVIFPVLSGKNYYQILSTSNEVKKCNDIKIRDIIELSLSFKDVNINYDDDVYFFIEMLENNEMSFYLPYDGYIYFKAPPIDFESLMWMK